MTVATLAWTTWRLEGANMSKKNLSRASSKLLPSSAWKAPAAVSRLVTGARLVRGPIEEEVLGRGLGELSGTASGKTHLTTE